MPALHEFYSAEGPERVGLILKSGEIIELENVAADPLTGATISLEDLLRYEDDAAATWHTHPAAPSNLSMDDYEAFKNWPHLKHYIIGLEGVRCFRVAGGRVLNADD